MTKFEHICIFSRDIKKSIEFYSYFGFEVIKECSEGTICTYILRDQHGSIIELQGDVSPQSFSVQFSGDIVFKHSQPMIHHLCFSVNDLYEYFEYCKDLDILSKNSCISIDIFGRNCFFIVGPNGEHIEIVRA